MRVEQIGTLAGLEAVRAEWDAFVESVGSDVYFTVDWLQAWWTYYGRGRCLECLVIRDGARMVGALPFFVERIWAGPFPTRVARFVGADSTLSVFTPAVLPGIEEGVLAAAVEWLITVGHCDAVSLSPLSGESAIAVAAESVATRPGLRLVRSDSTGPHTVFRLPPTFDEYLASLSASSRRDHRRYERHLRNSFSIEHRVVTGPDAVAWFDQFVTLHRAQWNLRGKPGHFADWPDGERFNRDLVMRMAADGRARFYVIIGDGITLAMEYYFVLGDRCFWRLRARVTDPELEKLRLGRVSAGELFRELIEHGTTMVETGPAHFDYKIRLGGVEYPLRRVIIARDTRSSVWKTKLLVRWVDLVHLAYYRIWFNHLARRVGRGGRRLWGRWVRTRL